MALILLALALYGSTRTAPEAVRISVGVGDDLGSLLFASPREDFDDPILPLPLHLQIIDPIDRIFPPEQRAMARCIRLAESGNNPRAVSPTDDHGWFQINAGIPRDGATYAEHYEKWGWTGWRAYFGEERWALVYEPWANTRMAFDVFIRGRWEPWTTKELCR